MSSADGTVLDVAFPAGRLRVFEVDDGDGSGAESRCDLTLSHNGEAGSGGKLQRLNREQVEAAITAFQQALLKMQP